MSLLESRVGALVGSSRQPVRGAVGNLPELSRERVIVGAEKDEHPRCAGAGDPARHLTAFV